MSSGVHPTAARDELIRVIRQVRRRWRLKNALRGAAITLAAGAAVLLASAWGLERLGFSPGAVVALRVVLLVAVVALLIRFVLVPLFRRVSDERVALYIEEHEPSLQAMVVSALEAGSAKDGHSAAVSPALVARLVESAIQRCREADAGRAIEHSSLLRSTGALAAAVAVTLAALMFSPAVVRHGASVLIFPWKRAEAASPYRIDVQPGHTTVARGADQRIDARLHGFTATLVEVAVRTGANGEWQRWPMTTAEGDSTAFSILLFDIESATDYYVEAEGVRSAVYRIEVADLPYVQRLDLEYRFPAYTGLSPQVVEDGGDIAVLGGTEVLVRALPTVPVEAGRIILDRGDTVALAAAQDGRLEGVFTVTAPGFYRIELQSPDGAMHPASPEYTIDVLEDQPPIVVLRKPGRDMRASAVDEVFVEANAEDDYGIGTLELVFSVNGGEEQTVQLFRAGERRPSVSAGHTFYFEELDLQPGDLVSYYARVKDNARPRPQDATSDIYFIEIRPFGRDYRQAEQMGNPGGGGDMVQAGALVQRRREIVAGTFNVQRDRAKYTDKEFRENLVTLALAQGKLREQVETLVARMTARGVIGSDTLMQAIAKALPQAAEEMKVAEEKLGAGKPDEALPAEQRALQHLQRAEAAFREVQVAMGQPGGAGGAGPNAEDLADLFELELDRMRNQYETVQRSQAERQSQQLDEVAERLRELARRQQQEIERQRRLQQNMQGGQGGSANQRELAEQADSVARQLERLAREQRSPELMQSARRLREAVEQMRRSAASHSPGAGQAALDRLEEARRLLEQGRQAGIERQIQDALAEAERLREQQERIASDVARLSPADRRSDQVRRLQERKQELASAVADLERRLDRLASASRAEQKDAARNLQEAANAIRDTKLVDKILWSRGVVQERPGEYARMLEEQIGADIDRVRENIEKAAASVGRSAEDRLAQALDRTRELVSGLDSFDDRLRERARQRGEAQQDESERPGSEEGRQGEQQRGQAAGQQQGEQGQQGGQTPQQGGAAGGPAQPGARDRGGYGGPIRLSPDDIRQFRREIQERQAEAEQIRRALQQEGIDVAPLDETIRRLRELHRANLEDLAAVERLQAQIVAGLKEFEYALRRQIQGDERERLFLSGSDDVPAEYRKLVEEYYRALSGGRRSP
jgi:hypothetical protein